ncbi:FAD-dependent monooxygenase [Nocardioides marinquilinus]|uniref:FAD-dependent monooxygenase n=1 Tax=Nocardioides marinquilinus TaxID=1210400 RepID=A0ABP9Q8I9_9ACTN
MTRHALVSGASIAGLSAAFWLARTGWEVTVLEKAEAFRDGGQNVDVRGVAREVLDRMGLFQQVKALNTTETGTVLVDEHGDVRAELPSDGPDGATAELEVLRGDLAGAVRDALPSGPDGRVELVFGDTVGTVDETGGGLTVVTEAGREIACDLLVVAEGVRSATRDRLFDDVDRHELGIDMAFATIPRIESDDDRWRWFTTVGGRQVHLRPDNRGTTRAILAFAPSEHLATMERDEALARLRERFADAGWQAPRVLDGFEASDDLYVDSLTQIRMPHWHRGRIALAGDAAWCVTPMGGGGASLALTGGYVLAAQLAAHPDDHEAALAAYEEWMRPLVDQVQKLPPGVDKIAYPQTAWGLRLKHVFDKVLTSSLLEPLTKKITQVADDDRGLPPIPA